MAGPEKDRDIICNIENPRMSEILYYTEFGVNQNQRNYLKSLIFTMRII